MVLDTKLTGDNLGGPAPWLKATFTQQGANTVQLKMEATGLVGTEFVAGWTFNTTYSPETALVVSYVAHSGFTTTASTAESWVEFGDNIDGLGKKYTLDWGYDLPTANNAGERLGAGDSITYNISAPGLTVAAFNVADANGWLSTAHVQSIAGGGSAKIAAIVPEPSTYIAAALLGIPAVIGFARTARRRGVSA